MRHPTSFRSIFENRALQNVSVPPRYFAFLVIHPRGGLKNASLQNLFLQSSPCFLGPVPALAQRLAPALQRKRFLVKEMYQILLKRYLAEAFPFQAWGHCPRPDMGAPPGAGNV